MTFDRSSVTIERIFKVDYKAGIISGIALLSAVSTGTNCSAMYYSGSDTV